MVNVVKLGTGQASVTRNQTTLQGITNVTTDTNLQTITFFTVHSSLHAHFDEISDKHGALDVKGLGEYYLANDYFLDAQGGGGGGTVDLSVLEASNAAIQIATEASAASLAVLETTTAGILTDTGNISTNTGDISTNTAAILLDTTAILADTANIDTSTAGIKTDTGNIATDTASIDTNIAGILADTSNIETATASINSKTPNDPATVTKQDEIIAAIGAIPGAGNSLDYAILMALNNINEQLREMNFLLKNIAE